MWHTGPRAALFRLIPSVGSTGRVSKRGIVTGRLIPARTIAAGIRRWELSSQCLGNRAGIEQGNRPLPFHDSK